MSTLLMCSVYDQVVRAYLPPLFVRTKAEAIRSFSDAVGDEKHEFRRHAADYHLALVGHFDDNSGVVTAVGPERLIGASECLPEF